MEEVAEEMGVHVSTVSRACRDKYLLCRWGMKELRSFFSAGVPSEGGISLDGAASGAIASGAVQELMRRLIAEEDSSKPLSDAGLAAALREKRGTNRPQDGSQVPGADEDTARFPAPGNMTVPYILNCLLII